MESEKFIEYANQHLYIVNNGFSIEKYEDVTIFKKQEGKFLIKINYLGELTPSLSYYNVIISFIDNDKLRHKIQIKECKIIDESMLLKIRKYIKLLETF